MTSLREHRIDVVAWRGKFVQYRDQFAGFNRRTDFPHGAPGQPFAVHGPVVEYLAVVAHHVPGHLENAVLAVMAEGPAALAAFAADGQAIVTHQVVRRIRGAM